MPVHDQTKEDVLVACPDLLLACPDLLLARLDLLPGTAVTNYGECRSEGGLLACPDRSVSEPGVTAPVLTKEGLLNEALVVAHCQR